MVGSGRDTQCDDTDVMTPSVMAPPANSHELCPARLLDCVTARFQAGALGTLVVSTLA
jgi:hypothetical protein